MKPRCYLCRRVLARTEVAGAVDFTFGTFPVCVACVEGEGA